MSLPFHFSGSLWVSPRVRDNISSLMHPYCLTHWLGLEGNVKILIPVDLLAKAAAPSATGRSRVRAWEWGKGRSSKITSPRRKHCPRRFSRKGHGNQKAWVQMSMLALSTWPALDNPGGLWTLFFEASVSLEMWGPVGVLWGSGHKYQAWPSCPLLFRTALFLSGWKVLHNILFEPSFLTLNLVKIH